MNDRIERLQTEASQLTVARSPGRDRLYQAAGAAAVVVGFAVAFGAYQMSLAKDDSRDIQSLLILSVAMLIVALGGAAVFLRYSLARFLRFWLLRQLYEGQAHIDQLVEALRPGAVPATESAEAPTVAEPPADGVAPAKPTKVEASG